jgi:hypothetical protein
MTGRGFLPRLISILAGSVSRTRRFLTLGFVWVFTPTAPRTKKSHATPPTTRIRIVPEIEPRILTHPRRAHVFELDQDQSRGFRPSPPPSSICLAGSDSAIVRPLLRPDQLLAAELRCDRIDLERATGGPRVAFGPGEGVLQEPISWLRRSRVASIIGLAPPVREVASLRHLISLQVEMSASAFGLRLEIGINGVN